jgi:DNA-binding transcriptional MocR family regulator
MAASIIRHNLPLIPVSTAGTITPLGRKREIYSICADYNVLILEDDPYYYLQFSTAHGGEPKGLNDLGRSYLSMDIDNRVIRLDSFSKVRQPLDIARRGK